MSNPNLIKLTNYLHALLCYDHLTVSQVAKQIPGFRETWLRDIRDGKSSVHAVLKTIEPVVKVPYDHLQEALDGSHKPVERLLDKARHAVHDRASLRSFMTAIAYTNGTTLQDMSYKMGHSGVYLNVLINRGTHERMIEQFDNIARQFKLSQTALENAVNRSQTRHRKFAGGNFKGQVHSSTTDSATRAMLDFLNTIPFEHPLERDKIEDGIKKRDAPYLVRGLCIFTLFKSHSQKALNQTLSESRLGKYIPYAKEYMDGIKKRAGSFTVVETAKFSDRIAEIGMQSPKFYLAPLINTLRALKNVYRYHSNCHKMKISGLKRSEVHDCTNQEAYDLAKKLYSNTKPSNMPFITDKRYETNYEKLLNNLKHYQTTSGFVMTRRTTVVSLGNRQECVIYLDNFMYQLKGSNGMRSINHLSPLIRHKMSAKKRKLLREFNN